MSKEEFASTIPVNPPKVNKKINPNTHNIEGVILICDPYKVANQLKILTPVGTAIIIVALVK